jgi:hypothetical protein
MDRRVLCDSLIKWVKENELLLKFNFYLLFKDENIKFKSNNKRSW